MQQGTMQKAPQPQPSHTAARLARDGSKGCRHQSFLPRSATAPTGPQPMEPKPLTCAGLRALRCLSVVGFIFDLMCEPMAIIEPLPALIEGSRSWASKVSRVEASQQGKAKKGGGMDPKVQGQGGKLWQHPHNPIIEVGAWAPLSPRLAHFSTTKRWEATMCGREPPRTWARVPLDRPKGGPVTLLGPTSPVGRTAITEAL